MRSASFNVSKRYVGLTESAPRPSASIMRQAERERLDEISVKLVMSNCVGQAPIEVDGLAREFIQELRARIADLEQERNHWRELALDYKRALPSPRRRSWFSGFLRRSRGASRSAWAKPYSNIHHRGVRSRSVPRNPCSSLWFLDRSVSIGRPHTSRIESSHQRQARSVDSHHTRATSVYYSYLQGVEAQVFRPEPGPRPLRSSS
jgi:hypothetical protein